MLNKNNQSLSVVNKKSISPLIATILLVVVSVIIISVLLNWGSAFTRKSLDDVSKTSDLKRDDTLFSSFQTYQQRSDGFVFKNLSNKKVEFTHYKIISEDAFKFSDILLPFDSTLQVSSGGQVSIPILCSPSSSYHVNLVTSEGTYVTVPINNIDSELNSCNSPEIPDLVCLGINDNGSGTSEEDPIVICSVDDLNNVRNGLDKHYKLGINLDLNVSPYNEGEGWLPIGNSSTKFSGSLNGSIYTISNLYINRPTTDYQGLFGYTDVSVIINNIKLENVNVTGSAFVGGLVGFNEGMILNSYSSGSVSGNRVGGLIGVDTGGFISNCYSNGFVFGIGAYIGGLVGYLDKGSIYNSYSTSSVFGGQAWGIGGLVGGLYGSVSVFNSYSTGLVSGTSSAVGGLVGDDCSSSTAILYNSYWDIQTSERSSSEGGTGKTTSEMQQQSTFSLEWDFDTVWQIQEGVTYPYLISNPQSPPPQ